MPLSQHSAWDGLAFADILFPTFVFISGAAAALSLRKLQRRLDLLLLQSPDQRRGKQLEEEEGDNDGPRSRSRYRQRQQQRRVARRVWAMKRAALWKVARRSAVLFALGLFLNNGYEARLCSMAECYRLCALTD